MAAAGAIAAAVVKRPIVATLRMVAARAEKWHAAAVVVVQKQHAVAADML
jgi:hypothetical protein